MLIPCQFQQQPLPLYLSHCCLACVVLTYLPGALCQPLGALGDDTKWTHFVASQPTILGEFYKVAVVTSDFLISLVCVYSQHYLSNTY